MGGHGEPMWRPNTKFVQDMPPKGGYPKIQIYTQNGRRGPSGAVIWGSIILCGIFGFTRIAERNADNRLNLKEKREARMAIMPYLQVEEDIKYSIARRVELEHEAKVMKNVPGWQVGASVYSK